jgi:RNA polymerase sigma-70 factor (ECF subfamily)
MGNRPGAEDLASQAFRTAFGPLPLGSSKGELRSCLLAMAKSVLASHWSCRLGLLVTSIDSEADSRYRLILELRLLEAYSIKEAARATGVGLSNAMVLQCRAHRMATSFSPECES